MRNKTLARVIATGRARATTAPPRARQCVATLLLAGLLVGLAGLPSVAAREERGAFVWRKTVRGDYHSVLQEVEATLARQNFTVNRVHDYREIFARRFAELGGGTLPFAEYRLVDFCNVQLALQSLAADLRMGVFMPCRIAVYQALGSAEVTLATTNPRFMPEALDNPALTEVVARMEAVLEAVFAAVEF